jgi:hypothetical protein
MWKSECWVIWLDSLKERDHLEDIGIDGRLFNVISKKRMEGHGLD